MKKKMTHIMALGLSLAMVLTSVWGVTPALAKEEKILVVTSDMVDAGGNVVIAGEWNRIEVPKEVGATRILFKGVTAGVVEIESGTKGVIELVSGDIGEISVVPAKLENMQIADFLELLKDPETAQLAIKQYEESKARDEKTLNTRPTLVAKKDAKIAALTVSGSVKLNLGATEVDTVKVNADGRQERLSVDIINYTGDVSVNQTDREDGKWTVATVKLRNSAVENLTVAGEGNGNIVLNGQHTEVKEVKVEKTPYTSVNVETEVLHIGEDAANATVKVLDEVAQLNVAADHVKVEVGNCASVQNAEVQGDNVSISGDGKLTAVQITGSGASVSTSGTDVEGENTYVPPVVVTPSVPSKPEEDTEAVTGSALRYTIVKNNSVKVTGLKDTTVTEVTIPSTIEGLPVTEIAAEAFSFNRTLQSVTIEASLDKIGKNAFRSSSALKAVAFSGGSVVEICQGAFQGCTALEEAILPEGLKIIGMEAFAECDSLKKVEMQEGVLVIGCQAFVDVRGDALERLTIPGSVFKIIGSHVVAVNSDSAELTITTPQGSYADTYFAEYSSWPITMNYEGTVSEAYTDTRTAEEIFLYEQNGTGSAKITGLTEVLATFDVEIPETIGGLTVTEIGEAAFTDSYLTSVVLPDTVTKIGANAFYGCNCLQTIEMPDTVTEIGAGAFNECYVLEAFDLPSGLTKIEAKTFRYCKGFMFLTIPDSVTELGEYAFGGCFGLEYDVTLSANLEKIGKGAFSGCFNLKEITIPEGVTELGELAFSETYELVSIVLPDTVTSIGKKAFGGCYKLAEITIPASVTEIGEDAFDYCAADFTITTTEGSYADTYAQDNGIPVVYE